MPPSPPVALQELIIKPGRAELNYWRDVWRYRELFYFVAWRDILVRDKQTVLSDPFLVCFLLAIFQISAFFFR
jgi:lipopolysaccharide transport system permease protein